MEEKTMVTIPIGYMCIHTSVYDGLVHRITLADRENDDLADENERLNAENAELHAENADLKLKIEHFDEFLKTSGGWYKDKYDEWLAEKLKDF